MSAVRVRPRTGLAAWVRRLILGWLTAAGVEYILLPGKLKPLDGLEGLAAMSPSRLLLVTAAVAGGLWLASRFGDTARWERRCIPLAAAAVMLPALFASFTWPLLGACLVLLALAAGFALFGWDGSPLPAARPTGGVRWARRAVLLLALAFFLLVTAWTAGRYLTFSAPTYDFGIFSQMFHHMRAHGLPDTTLERDGLLSHLKVHVSPIYYLLLPFYCLAPSPVTIQALQAAVMASAVIPLWLLARRRGLSSWLSAGVCGMLLLYPAYAGGAGYDIHENCFLTPLLLWLFYGLDSRKASIAALFTALTLLVKEDAAVYTAVAGLYILVRGLLRREKWDAWAGSVILAVSLLYFGAVTRYLAVYGDGVMTYRYENFMFGEGQSLLTVVLAVLLCPMKAVYECMDPEKLSYILWTMLPLLGLPLMTRRYERLILLIPYVLVNLMSDYRYQHDLFYQYAFGSTACLVYLTAVNLAELAPKGRRLLAGGLVCACALSFGTQILPTAFYYPGQYIAYSGYYTDLEKTLSQVPKDAAVSATTFYTAHLSGRDTLYDVRYSSRVHLLSTDYLVLAVDDDSSYTLYGGFDEFTALLEAQGYTRWLEYEDRLVIYRKA